MRRDLLGAHSLEEGLHVVEVRENQRVLVAVVRMNITLPHILEVLLIVALAILGGIGWLWRLLGLCLHVLHLVLVGSLELGLHIVGY